MKQRRPITAGPQPAPQQVPAPHAVQLDVGNAALAEQLGLSSTGPGASGAAGVAEAYIQAGTVHDTEALYNLFSEDATFSDPIFGDLDAMGNLGKLGTEHDGSGATIRYDPDYEVSPSDDGNHRVTLRWEADYELLGQPIHNEVVTTLIVDSQGKIVSQVDDYDKAAWLDQALAMLHSGARGWVQRHVLTPFLEYSLPHKGAEMKEGYDAE